MLHDLAQTELPVIPVAHRESSFHDLALYLQGQGTVRHFELLKPLASEPLNSEHLKLKSSNP